MIPTRLGPWLVLAAAGSLGLPAAHGAFHVMQIEEVIGGVDGNPTAQAIVLRLRSAGQTLVSSAKLVAFDAAGANPVTLLDITTNISNGASGASILLTTPAFNTIMQGVVGYHTDFTLASGIPTSYLSGGKVSFEGDDGTIYWSLAFGNYTGSNAGNTINDPDGNFGQPFASALPTDGEKAVRFTGPATAASTTNVADYAFSPVPATVVNNNGATFTVVPEPGTLALLGFGAAGLGAFICRRRQRS